MVTDESAGYESNSDAEGMSTLIPVSELFLQDQDNYTAYLFAEEAERVRRSHERAWEKRGLEQGLEKGREEEKISGVLKLHEMNMNKEFIAEFTGYSLKKVNKIIANAQKNAASGKHKSRKNKVKIKNFDDINN